MEKPAVKTTIVGGRPPGSGKDVGSVPRGLEILIKKASIDPDFKEVLLTERSKAASRIDLTLEETEIAMINAVPGAHLEGVISATKVSPNFKQAFMGCTAAVMLAALTATANAADDYRGVTKGISPDYNGTRGVQPDIVDLVHAESPYFRKAEADTKLETGTFIIRVMESYSDFLLNSIKVHFVKIADQGGSGGNPTEGLGYTIAGGIYRIDGVPVGKYLVEVGRDSRYYFQSEEVEIVANVINLFTFNLDRKGKAGTMGIRAVEKLQKE